VSRLRAFRTNPIVDGIITVVSAILIAYVVQLLIVKPYRIPSESMVPTLEVRDRVITARFLLRFRDPQRGEIFVFHPNGRGSDVFQPAPGQEEASTENYVKRVVGLPNETIGSLNGKVYTCAGNRVESAIVDNELNTSQCAFLDEPYVHGQPTTTCQGSSDVPPTYIPAKHYLMLGDNRQNSADGRCWGLTPRSQMIGRVFMTYWPLSRISFR
jgi:signal peptidase I